MRATKGQPTLLGQKRAASRAVALMAGGGCVVVMAASGGASASASTASPARSAAAGAGALQTPSVAGVPATSWPAFMDGPLHNSYAPRQTVITPTTATTLVQKWSQTIGAPYLASPIVNRGSVYVGAGNGMFYRLSKSTGRVLAAVNLGFQPHTTCPYGGLGVTSTATIAQDPRTHVLTVYVAGGDGYLYALRALTLTTEWRSVIGIPSTTQNDYYDWSSPTVANGKIYVGVASSCDRPLVRGAVLGFRQATGAKFAAFYTVPAGARNYGASVWSSIAVAQNGDVFATTGNGPYGRPRLRYSESILKLNPNTLALMGRYQVPTADVAGDGDFGASPEIFGGLVGACNKNGIFYALRQSTMTLAWKQHIGHSTGAGPKWGTCLATPVYNGKDLYFAGNATTIGGVFSYGSVQERSPSTGALIRETPLPGGPFGSPTMDGAGVIAVGTYSTGATGVFLIDAATGAILAPAGSPAGSPLISGATFGQSAYAEGQIFSATSTGVYAFGPPAS
jgi:outer membrane protein assembly factor BamB